jgi:hypothetical protein
MNAMASSPAFLRLPGSSVKSLFAKVLSLAWASGFSYDPQHAPGNGQYESEALPCNRFLQEYGPALNGG